MAAKDKPSPPTDPTPRDNLPERMEKAAAEEPNPWEPVPPPPDAEWTPVPRPGEHHEDEEEAEAEEAPSPTGITDRPPSGPGGILSRGPFQAEPGRSATTGLSASGIPAGGTVNFEVPTPELRVEGSPPEGGTVNFEVGQRKADATPAADESGEQLPPIAPFPYMRVSPIGTLSKGAVQAEPARTEGPPVEANIGRVIVTHRQEVLENGPVLKEAVNEVLAWYEQNRPNDEETQQFVGQLERLSTELDTYLAIIQKGPSESEAETAGKSLFEKILSSIEVFEDTTTGDKFVRLTACAALLGMATLAAPTVTPYMTVPLLTACVFPKEAKKAASLLTAVESLYKRVFGGSQSQ